MGVIGSRTGAEARERRAALVVGSAGVFVALAAFTTALTDAPTLGRELAAGPRSQVWVLSSMSVGLAAAQLVAGVLADDRGRRRTLVGGALVFVLGSLACAAAHEPVLFVAGRIAEGIGGAALIAASLALTSTWFPSPQERATAGAVWGASLGAGIATGPFLPGLLDPLSWRASYAVLAAAGALVAVAGTRLSETRAAGRHRLDLPGSLLFASAMTLLLVALVESRGAASAAVPVALGVLAVAASVAFVVVEHRTEHPMLDLRLFARPDLVATTVAALAAGAGIIAVMSYSASHLSGALGAPTLAVATAFACWSVPSVVTALLARRLPARLTAGGRQLALGLLVTALGQGLLVATAASTSLAAVVPGFLLAGIGTGVLNGALGRESVATAPPGRGGLGSGINNTARYLGSAVGVTVVSLVATGAATATDGWRAATVLTAGVSLLGAVLVLGLTVLSARRRP